MNEREAFERTLELDPDNTVTRLAFADWLEEQGDDAAAEHQRKYTVALPWMRDFAERHHAYSFFFRDWAAERWGEKDKLGRTYTPKQIKERSDEFLKEMLEYLEGHTKGGKTDFSFDLPDPFPYSDELWDHFETLTGIAAPQGEYRYAPKESFRCSC